jgi:hypothetical protein
MSQKKIICHFKWKGTKAYHKFSEQIKCIYVVYDLIQKSTNTDVDPGLVHLQGVKGHPTNKLTSSLKLKRT